MGDTKTLDVHVKRLRSRIEDDPADPQRITTIRGLGYRFEVKRPTDGGSDPQPARAARRQMS